LASGVGEAVEWAIGPLRRWSLEMQDGFMGRGTSSRRAVVATGVALAIVAAALTLNVASAFDESTTTSIATAITTAPSTSITTTTTIRRIDPAPTLRLGSSGAAVLSLQRRLAGLGYWLGAIDGTFADTTQQAVYAFQKVARLTPDGVVGPLTHRALVRNLRYQARSASGNLVEINLARDLLTIVRNGRPFETINTSTGGGYTYWSDGYAAVARTPIGVFRIMRSVNGLDISPLGQLWRPRYFYNGYAIHGGAYVPPIPVSHGCVRVSNKAMDWIWASNIMPIGTRVWVYQ
jgi:N-acetylmuramoyl-L-alanine amidase